MKRTVSVVFLVAGLLVAASPAFAQRDLEIPIAFDFINPGARSLALGGAFIGVADDATAATTNPAGLHRLSRKEVSIEGRGWQFITDFVQGGRLSGVATQRGFDTTAEPVFGQTKTRVPGLSFVSFVYPKGQWRFAGYRQEASRTKTNAQTTGAFFTETDSVGVRRDFREFPTITERELNLVNWGGTASVRAGIVSVGGGVYVSQLSYDSLLTGFNTPADFYAAPVYTQQIYQSTQTGDDTGLGFSAGVMVSPNDMVQFGASYRRGAKFDFEGNLNYPGFPEVSGTYTGEFKAPDNFGAGVSVRPFQGLMIAFDVNRVTYSDLTDFVRTQVRFFEEDRPLYSVDDATEVHLGGEYVFSQFALLPAVRAGVWRETQHAVTYTGTDILYTTTASLARDVTHFSFGGGIAPSPRFEINAGFDVADTANTMSFSAILRF